MKRTRPLHQLCAGLVPDPARDSRRAARPGPPAAFERRLPGQRGGGALPLGGRARLLLSAAPVPESLAPPIVFVNSGAVRFVKA